jgi:hypothetical protein
MFSPLPDVPAPLFFYMATVGGWLLLGEGEEVAWCAATVCSVPSVWAEGIPLDGVRGLNWNGVTTHAHFQSFLPFRIFVQSSCNPVSLSCHRRRPTGGLLSPTLNSFPGNVWFCACTAVLIPLHSGSESVAPIRCGQALTCIILPWPDDRLKLSRAFGNAGRWAAGLDAGV